MEGCSYGFKNALAGAFLFIQVGVVLSCSWTTASLFITAMLLLHHVPWLRVTPNLIMYDLFLLIRLSCKGSKEETEVRHEHQIRASMSVWWTMLQHSPFYQSMLPLIWQECHALILSFQKVLMPMWHSSGLCHFCMSFSW